MSTLSPELISRLDTELSNWLTSYRHSGSFQLVIGIIIPLLFIIFNFKGIGAKWGIFLTLWILTFSNFLFWNTKSYLSVYKLRKEFRSVARPEKN